MRSPARYFPQVGNTLSAYGFLPYTYGDRLPTSVAVPRSAIILATIASLGGGSLLLTASVAAMRRCVQGAVSMPIFFGVAMVGAILARPVLYDRYLLAVLPSALILVALATRSTRLGSAMTLVGVLVFATWGVWWERDYLSRQATVWQVGRALVERGIPPSQIDGGLEWNGWHRGDDVVATAIASTGFSPGRLSLGVEVARRLVRSDAPWYIDFAIRPGQCQDRVIDVSHYGDRHPVYGLERCSMTPQQ
jgi:hypothetical protein